MAEYVVKSKDTVSQILKDQGYADYGKQYMWDEVAKLSGLASPHRIYPGQKLTLPTVPGAAPAAAPVTAPTAKPQAEQQVTPYLQQYQAQTQAQAAAPKTKYEEELTAAKGELEGMTLPTETDEQRLARIEGQLTPDMAKPEIPSLKEEFFELREEYGLEGLEEQSTLIQDDIIAIENEVREMRGLEEGKAVAMNVISGRITERERQAYVRLDYLNRSATRLNNQMTSANNMISTIMQLTQTDYENARTSYNDAVQLKMNTYSAFRAEVESDRDFNLRIMGSKLDISEKLYEVEQRQIEKAQDMARANLEIMTNAIIDGNISYSDMDEGTKVQISKMEAQAGLPAGFTAKLQSSQPDAEIVSTTSRQDASGMNYVDIVTRDRRTGEIKVTSQQTGASRLPSSGGSSSGGGSDYSSTEYKEAARIFESVDKSAGDADGQLSPDEYDQAYQQVLAMTHGDADKANVLSNQVWEQVGYKEYLHKDVSGRKIYDPQTDKYYDPMGEQPYIK